jgi:(1->4)-alpha-D-glucan 1-alpha-D-glucosylmutase
MYLAGAGVDRVDELGNPLADDDFLLALNASGEDLELKLPMLHARGDAQPWELVIDTADDTARETRDAGETVAWQARSLKLFRRSAVSKTSTQLVENVPSSTYRLQLHKGFTFANAAAILDYLQQLGVGAVYTSPYTHAEQGSTHGYNVVDHGSLNPELGGPDAHAALAAAIRDKGLGHLLDFVPNHVGIGSCENRWWLDVLENGPASQFSEHFDIDWHPPTLGLENRVLLPVLGRQFGLELEDGKLSVVRKGGSFEVAYYERRWPASPRSYKTILALATDRVKLPKDDPHLQEMKSICREIEYLPAADDRKPEHREERAREKEIIKRRLAELCTASAEVRDAIDGALAEKNPSEHGHGDIEWLDAFLQDQNYRLAYWRVATEEINYRRFFDVNELAAIRMEDPRVFDATHALVLDLVARGSVTGLRLDHTDGLYEPQAYFRTLQQRLRAAIAQTGRRPPAHLYVIAEKILEPGEELPRNWQISGTSGYDFLAAINGVWVDATAEHRMTELYAKLGHEHNDFHAMVFYNKRHIMETSLSAETIMLGQELRRLAEADRRSRDFTLTSLTSAIKAAIAGFPVYRTYIAPDGSRQPTDETHIEQAIELAMRKTRGLDPSVFEYLRDVLLLRVSSPEAVHFAMRFQQLTGPVMAKAVEDTSFYRYNRLVSLNEVGCDPSRFGGSVEELHRHNAAMLAAFPLTMTTTTTHDTKRSEDVRTRLAVLSEMPDEWEARVRHWFERAKPFTEIRHHRPYPSPNDLYLFFQSAVGAWPMTGDDPSLNDRLSAYMLKAIREAKVETSWTTQEPRYEEAVDRAVKGLLGDADFTGSVHELVGMVATHGACNSLAQLAIKLASPGVADVYQGNELWDLSLVDPDNRRPVDYELRRRMLAELPRDPSPELARQLVDGFADGRIKLHVTRTGLAMRQHDRLLFLEGTYRAIDGGEHVIAFERARGTARLVCIAPRLSWKLSRGERPWPLGDAWGDRSIAVGAGRWRNAFTGETFEGDQLALRDVLAVFPVAWLTSV